MADKNPIPSPGTPQALVRVLLADLNAARQLRRIIGGGDLRPKAALPLNPSPRRVHGACAVA